MLILWEEKAILSSCGDARHLISININIKNAHSTGTASRWEKARTWTCLHANIHAVKHGVMNVIYLHMLGKTTEIFFSSIHQRVFLLSGEQVLNKMLELKPEFKMKCFKMHSKQQLQARAGPDSLLMLA